MPKKICHLNPYRSFFNSRCAVLFFFSFFFNTTEAKSIILALC
jgi:hypothetical protein